MKEEKIKVSARYAYHVQDPFEVPQPMYDKYGAVHFISWSRYLEECKKPKNVFTLTTFESVMPSILMAALFLLICFIIGQAL